MAIRKEEKTAAGAGCRGWRSDEATRVQSRASAKSGRCVVGVYPAVVGGVRHFVLVYRQSLYMREKNAPDNAFGKRVAR